MKDSPSHRCGEASADAEVFAGQDAEPSVRWRKRPVVVDAIQFTGNNCIACVRFMGGPWRNMELHDTDQPYIQTLEGDLVASPGDWIVKGVQGEFYPCKPDIFAATYDPESPAQDALLIERAAEKVYDAMVWAALTRERPVPNWTEGGNSLAQYEARRAARYILALSASAPNPAEPGWQPISSAPRDGTHFFVTCRQEPRSELYVGHWWIGLARFNPGYPNGPPYLEFESNSPSRPRREQIKLWRPLPTPPVEAASPAHAELSPGNSSDLRGEES